MSEAELVLYNRIHRSLSANFVFGGKPVLEHSFGTIMYWLLRRVAYCLEEPSFLKAAALEWLRAHRRSERIALEDGFFLPAIYERLRDAFGSRVVKKPEQFGGEVDILFDLSLPVELKVRRGHASFSFEDIVKEKFRAAGQAAAYAATSRLGLVLVLDLPNGGEVVANIDQCACVLRRESELSGAFPTCIVVLVFHCHHPIPSRITKKRNRKGR
jgi:hypothetical protein